MKNISIKHLQQTEIDACVAYLEKNWELDIFRTPSGSVITTRDFVATIFEQASTAAERLQCFMPAQKEFNQKIKEREAILEHRYPEKGYDLYDGMTMMMHDWESFLSKARNVNIKNSGNVLEVGLQKFSKYTGIERSIPRGLSKFLELRSLDPDEAFETSETLRKSEASSYPGISSEIIDHHITTNLSLNAVGNALSYGRTIKDALIREIFAHGHNFKIHCNELELKAEVNSLDANAPFVNAQVPPKGKWAKMTFEDADAPQRRVHKLPEEKLQSIQASHTPPKEISQRDIDRIASLKADLTGPA